MSLKEGNVITVQTEQAVRDYEREGRDIENVMVEVNNSKHMTGDFREVLKKLKDSSVYKIVRNDLHDDLKKFGVQLYHYSLTGSKINSVAFPTAGVAKINGNIDINYEDKNESGPLSEAVFMDEREAQAIATGLNTHELNLLRELQKSLAKAETMLSKITDNKMV
jgi:hypothetical protein